MLVVIPTLDTHSLRLTLERALATEGEHTYLSDFHSTNYTYPQGDGRLVRRGTSSLRSTSPPGDGSMRCRDSEFMAGDLPSNI